MDEDSGVLEIRERQLRNVPEELGWWYRVDSKTVGRYCNRCACWLPREEWDLGNWKQPVYTYTEAKVATCINYNERNQSSQRIIRKCTERHSEVLGIRLVDPRFSGGNTGVSYPRERGSSVLVGHWFCTCVTPPFFSQTDSPAGGSYEVETDKSVVIMTCIIWDGLNVVEIESVISWMTMS
jgi:hypothetical protein